MAPETSAASFHKTSENENGSKDNIHKRNRLLLLIVAVGSSWGTSLQVAIYCANFAVAAPKMSVVYGTITDVYNVTKDERLQYSTCVESQLNQCNGRLDKSIEREDQRIRVILKNNYELLLRAENIALQCSKTYTTLRHALEAWTALGGVIPTLPNGSPNPYSDSTCSPADRENVNETLLGNQNTVAKRAEAMEINSEFGNSTTRTVDNLFDYYKRREEYDRAYLKNHTQQIRNAMYGMVDGMQVPPADLDDLFEELDLAGKDLIACLSMDENDRKRDGSKCQPNMAEMIQSFYGDARWKVRALGATLIVFNEKLAEYENNVLRAAWFAKRFYEGVNSAVAKWAIKAFTGYDWWSFSLIDITPSDLQFPDIDKIFGTMSIGMFPDIDWELVAPNIDQFDINVGTVNEEITKRVQKLLWDTKNAASLIARNGLLVATPEDYNPPKYVGTSESIGSPAEEVAAYKKRSTKFINESKENLGLVPGSGTSYVEDVLHVDFVPFNTTEIKSKATNIGNANYEALQAPDVDVDFWFLKFEHLSDGFVYLDYVFRVYDTMRLLFKYWWVTSLAMPSIDLRVNKDINPFCLRIFKMNPLRAVVTIATNPIGISALGTFFGFWVIFFIASLYTPLFNQYSHGCVSIHGNGTFLSQNIYSIAYNHAYQDGRNMLLEGSDVFDRKRKDACSSKYSKSAKLQNEISSNFTTYANFHKDLLDNMGLAQRCIDTNELDTSFSESCCGIADYPECTTTTSLSNVACPMDDRRTMINEQFPFDLPGDLLGAPTCSATLSGSEWKINDATFNCDDLSYCTVTCQGPSKERLEKASETCGCTIGWYLHSKVIGFALAILLCVLMNIARVLFFKGVTRFYWKHLYPNRFTLSMTCDSEGTLVTPSSRSGFVSFFQGNRRQDIPNKVRKKLSEKLRKFCHMGVVYLVGFCVFAGLCICLTLFVSQNMVPRVWQ